MENSEFLFVTAEVGVAFTGFAGLVTVLARRLGSPGTHRVDVARLRLVLIGSIITVLISLLPYVAAQLISGPSSWSISALISATAIAFLLCFEVIVPVTKFRRDGNVANLNMMIVYLTILALSACILALLVCVLIYPSLVQAIYVVTIYTVIFVVGITLVRLFISLASSES